MERDDDKEGQRSSSQMNQSTLDFLALLCDELGDE